MLGPLIYARFDVLTHLHVRPTHLLTSKGPTVSARLSRRRAPLEEEGGEDEAEPQQEQELPRRRSMAARLPSTKGSPSTSHESSLARRMPKVLVEGKDNQPSSRETAVSCPGDEAAHGTSSVLEQVQYMQHMQAGSSTIEPADLSR